MLNHHIHLLMWPEGLMTFNLLEDMFNLTCLHQEEEDGEEEDGEEEEEEEEEEEGIDLEEFFNHLIGVEKAHMMLLLKPH